MMQTATSMPCTWCPQASSTRMRNASSAMAWSCTCLASLRRLTGWLSEVSKLRAGCSSQTEHTCSLICTRKLMACEKRNWQGSRSVCTLPSQPKQAHPSWRMQLAPCHLPLMLPKFAYRFIKLPIFLLASRPDVSEVGILWILDGPSNGHQD